MLSVSQIYDWVAAQLHEVATDDQLDANVQTVSTNLLLRWINESMNEIARAGPWQWLEAQETLTFGGHGAGTNTTDGVTYLPEKMWRIVSVWPGSRGYREPLQLIGAWELDSISPSTTLGTVSDFLAVWGYYGVARDNPVAGTISVTDAAATAVEVRIHGKDGNGNEVIEDVAHGGASTATFAAGPEGVRRVHIIDNTVTAATTTVTVTGGDGTTTIETLRADLGERSHEHLRTELSPAPTATADHLVRYYRRVREVRNDNDMVELPYEFENLLIDGIARRLALFQLEMEKVPYFEQRFQRGVRELRRFQNKQPGRFQGMKQLASYGTELLYRG
jgi:hypothetical protein